MAKCNGIYAVGNHFEPHTACSHYGDAHECPTVKRLRHDMSVLKRQRLEFLAELTMRRSESLNLNDQQVAVVVKQIINSCSGEVIQSWAKQVIAMKKGNRNE